MENSAKKSIKLTTAMQFQQLVYCMDEYPYLATGCPQFGSSKSATEDAWEMVAKKVNAYGPPARSGSEWKKVWTDLKCRLKKKIADNNRNLNETGGGPCRVSNLTELECDIDRICHISAAAAPGGKFFGPPKPKMERSIQKNCSETNVSVASAPIIKQKTIYYSHNSALEVTPPRRNLQIAVVTPTSCSTDKVQEENSYPQEWVVCDSPPTTSKKPATEGIYQMTKAINSTGKENTLKRKRKYSDKEEIKEHRVELLQQQCEIQAETLKAIKAQAEAAKECVAAVRECTEAMKEQSASLKVMAESMKLMTKAMFDVVKHFTEEKPTNF